MKKPGKKTGIESLKRNPRTSKMSNGVKVLINTKDDNGNQIIEYGYILRRLDAHSYHIVGELSDKEYFLSPEEFKEIKENNFLYGIRNKIR